jgi:superfamily I DNA/RNA helicase
MIETINNWKPSVHKAKGLEWGKVVLIADTFKNRSKSEEEANIYYVAVTRAKKTLVWGEK